MILSSVPGSAFVGVVCLGALWFPSPILACLLSDG